MSTIQKFDHPAPLKREFISHLNPTPSPIFDLGCPPCSCKGNQPLFALILKSCTVSIVFADCMILQYVKTCKLFNSFLLTCNECAPTAAATPPYFQETPFLAKPHEWGPSFTPAALAHPAKPYTWNSACRPSKLRQAALQCQLSGGGHVHSVLKLCFLVAEQKMARMARPAHPPP
eukprot:1146837-Pelagomonas_calceolata.AAC.7